MPKYGQYLTPSLSLAAMSFLFGGKKKNAAPTAGEAIQKLRETEEMLQKKTDFLEGKITQV